MTKVQYANIFKFIRYYQNYVDCQDSEELPPHTNRDYEYIPKPPENPPVFPVAEFMHYFEQPDCAGTATDCLDLMPKRVVGPLKRGEPSRRLGSTAHGGSFDVEVHLLAGYRLARNTGVCNVVAGWAP